MSLDGATFTGPTGEDPVKHFETFIFNTRPTQEELLAAGQYLRGQIRKRTFAGQSFEGGRFHPYSPTYAKWKGQTNVDLYGRGAGKHMLDALQVRTTASPSGSGETVHDSIEIGIYGDEKMATRAYVHDNGADGRSRMGTGKHKAVRKSRQFGADIRTQKKGGKVNFWIPQRAWLGATLEDINTMRKMIVQLISDRLSGL